MYDSVTFEFPEQACRFCERELGRYRPKCGALICRNCCNKCRAENHGKCSTREVEILTQRNFEYLARRAK